MTTQTRTNARYEQLTVLDAVPATVLDSPAGTGAIAIFYGASTWPPSSTTDSSVSTG